MRYINLVLIFIMAALTWHVSKLEARVPVRVHHDIQMDMTKIIRAAIESQLPNVKDVRFSKLFSETTNENEVHVFFEYNYNDPQTNASYETGISGSAIVKRNEADPATWVLEKVKLSQSTIEFKDGIIVTREGVKDGTAD